MFFLQRSKNITSRQFLRRTYTHQQANTFPRHSSFILSNLSLDSIYMIFSFFRFQFQIKRNNYHDQTDDYDVLHLIIVIYYIGNYYQEKRYNVTRNNINNVLKCKNPLRWMNNYWFCHNACVRLKIICAKIVFLKWDDALWNLLLQFVTCSCSSIYNRKVRNKYHFRVECRHSKSKSSNKIFPFSSIAS